MEQTHGSIDFDELFVSVSILTLSTDFSFYQVELRCTWHHVDAILLLN